MSAYTVKFKASEIPGSTVTSYPDIRQPPHCCPQLWKLCQKPPFRTKTLLAQLPRPHRSYDRSGGLVEDGEDEILPTVADDGDCSAILMIGRIAVTALYINASWQFPTPITISFASPSFLTDSHRFHCAQDGQPIPDCSWILLTVVFAFVQRCGHAPSVRYLSGLSPPFT